MRDLPSRSGLASRKAAADAVVPTLVIGFARRAGDDRVSVLRVTFPQNVTHDFDCGADFSKQRTYSNADKRDRNITKRAKKLFKQYPPKNQEGARLSVLHVFRDASQLRLRRVDVAGSVDRNPLAHRAVR